MKITKSKFILGILVLAGTFCFFYLKDFSIKNELDTPNKSNDQAVEIFNNEVEFQIEGLRRSLAKPMIAEGEKNLYDYMKTIKTIETYARYGVNSTENRNQLRVKVTFNDGKILDQHTDLSCSGNFEPCLLIKVEIKDGRAVKVFTNGQEKKRSPKDTRNNISAFVSKVFTADLVANNDKYYPPKKTEKDFEKEWQNAK